MTHWGTNTYLVGENEVAVIDPGPNNPGHLAAILDAAGGSRVTRILITHAHRDHTGLASELQKATGAPILGFGGPEIGRSPAMQALAADGLGAGIDGVDLTFRPDETLCEGQTLKVEESELQVIHMPGHSAGHLGFRLGSSLFSGDHAMDWATTVIAPPDGDLTAFMATTQRLCDMDLDVLWPGHGETITRPTARLQALLAHRRKREAEILAALHKGHHTVDAITAHVYRDLASHLLPAAAFNVLAHLIDLTHRNLISPRPRLSRDARFEATSR
ncbi:MAG: MBL fold metallo-hydrolase [Pseudomonadota bacterium]